MEPIQYFNRGTHSLETEAVYGEAYLNWTYGHPLGRLSLEVLVKRAAFSRWYGWRMDKPASREKIAPFIEQYDLDPNEFADAVDRYGTFNEFFYRRLKLESRPIAPEENALIFPADGRHFAFQDISAIEGFYVKGTPFNLASFVNNDEIAERYANGSLLFSRLCPVDYHRFHFPVGGCAGSMQLIKGPLYSVSPIALRRRLAYLWENKRCLTPIETKHFGTVLMCPIGATCVGGIEATYEAGGEIAKGDEMGYFQFGGSSTIVLFEPNRVRFSDDLLEWSAKGIELYAKMGDIAGRVESGAASRP